MHEPAVREMGLGGTYASGNCWRVVDVQPMRLEKITVSVRVPAENE